MPMPPSVTKINKDGITFTSNVDQVKYSIEELTKAAFRDVGKLLRKKIKAAVPVDRGVLRSNVSSWVRKDKRTGKIELQVGVYTPQQSKKKGLTPAYHAHLLQFGHLTVGGDWVPAIRFLDRPVYESIDDIVSIEAQYLLALNKDNDEVAGLINEGMEEEVDGD